MTPERVAEIRAIIGTKPKPLPAPKVVTIEGVIIRDADVPVARGDRNWIYTDDGVVRVRRPEWVTIDMAAYERQQAERERDRQERRALDPYRLGLYGSLEDE